MKIRPQSGFTIYELMITLLIVGIVLTLGIPNLSAFNANGRIEAASSDLRGGFELARSEAIRARATTTICASNNSAAAEARCQGRWADGFIVFIDHDGDLQRAAIGEPVIRAYPAAAVGLRFATAHAADLFSFAPTGFGRSDIQGVPAVSQIVICDERGSANGRLLTTTPVGQTTLVKEYELVRDALQSMDKDCS